MDSLERLRGAVLLLILASIIIAIVEAFSLKNWISIFLLIFTLVLIFSPYIFERRYKIDLPIEIELTIIIFIYSSLYLGTIQQYYTLYWWWDIVLHGGSAIALGLIGFLIVLSLHRSEKIDARPILIALLTFSFALSIGALWEIVEFTMDNTYSVGIQQYGLVDTMLDLIVDAFGAFIASILGYIYLKEKETYFFRYTVKKYIKNNPRIFKKRQKNYKR